MCAVFSRDCSLGTYILREHFVCEIQENYIPNSMLIFSEHIQMFFRPEELFCFLNGHLEGQQFKVFAMLRNKDHHS